VQSLHGRQPGGAEHHRGHAGRLPTRLLLCPRALDRGLHYDPCRGILRAGTVIAGETEEEIYTALDLPWLDSETQREEIPIDARRAL
jgi:hypothetical protein